VNILRVILATLVIFGTGAVSGFFIGKNRAVSNAVDSSKTFVAGGKNSAPPLERGRRSMMDRMQNDLDLTDEQRDTIGAIFAESRERSKELWKEIKEPMDNEVKRVHEEVKAVLTPEQAVKFEEINERRESFRNKNRGGDRPEDQDEEKKTGSADQCFIRSILTHQCAL
jgi:Spy/CpxP family protein refolding chaperone